MAKVLQTAHVFLAPGQSLSAGTETAVATTPPSPTPFEVNHVRTILNVLMDYAATGGTMRLRLYRGASLSAPLAHVAPNMTPSYTAGTVASFGYAFAEDVVGFDSVQYTLSILVNGANASLIEVMVEVTVS